ncbi:hypothetical protein [Ornithinimicrobium cavernae]|uniref:hypothetical protein n=1 Tax=Ornithinimicrobium cavernae TaxID=2666047 RepID=UPI0012B183DE|nr:hypothetical protein [Ornithinimicrobium cavernae]
MRQSGRGATPGLPSHIGVPAVSGGGRDDRVPVLGVYDSPELDGWVALQLDRECEVPAPGPLPEGIELSGLSVSDLSRTASTEPTLLGGATISASDDDLATTDGWLCRCFPSLPGCRN